MSALTGGVAPAFAKPDHDDPVVPVVPTTEVVAPEAPQAAPAEEAPASAPKVEASAPVPPKPEPRVIDAPKADAPKADAPKADAPKADAPVVEARKIEAPKADTPKADAPKVDTPTVDTPKVDTLRSDAPVVEAPKTGQPPAAAEPSTKPGDVTNSNAGPDQSDVAKPPHNLVPRRPSNPAGEDVAPGQTQPPVADEKKPGSEGSDTDASDPSTVTKATPRIPTAQPETLQAPEQDVQLAWQAKPVELKPEPAARHDVDFLSNAINVSNETQLAPFQSEFNVGSEFSVGRDRDRDHDWDWDNKKWDHNVRQWNRNWIQYDDWYRPVIFNPYRAPVRIVYVYQYAPRIVIVPPLARVVMDAVQLAAYSFTAVVLNAANLAADVAVGSFFGGGYLPAAGAPFTPPPPLLRYDNVPVQVRYSNATYEPFRVRQIVDVGDDAQYGGRKVLLDGATPAWGQWTTSPTGERQFEVHRTQQFPGLGDPQEAPLPGDYRMRLASDESAHTDRTQMYLVAAAGVVAGLGFAALGAAFYLGRRRLQH